MTLRMLCGAVGAACIGLASPALAIDPFFPTFGNNGIDVAHYNIDLDVDPVSGLVNGRTILAIKAEKRLRSFTLDLHALLVSSVRINGASVPFSQADDKITVTPNQPIDRGKSFVVTIDYAGNPDPLPDPTAPGFDLFLGWFKYENSTYALSEPIGASTFFPANDEPTDKATYTFGITVPFGYHGVANGVPLGSISLGTKTRYQWAMLQPMTTWLATVHVNKLNVFTQWARGGTPVRVYYSDNIPQADVQGYALAAEMLPYFESLVGPYPFKSYGSIVVEDPILYYALETQAMSTFPVGAADEAIVAHELAHQWFGNQVSVARWEDLWIAEGIATYFEILWPNRNDPAAFDAAMIENYNFVASAQLGPAVVEVPEEMFSARTYNRGAAALYALRLTVGDPTFYRILRRFVNEYRGGNASTMDFINTAVRVSRKAEVRPLLIAWLYETPVPLLPGVDAATAARSAARSTVAAPNLVGNRCGRGSHRGAPREC